MQAILSSGHGSSTKTSWLVICASGDYVAESVSFPVSARSLLDFVLLPDASFVGVPGGTIVVHAQAIYADGREDVTGTPEITFTVIGPAAYLGNGAFQILGRGIVSIGADFETFHSTAQIKIGPDEVFASKFE